MMGLVYNWVRVKARIDHDPVDKVIDHSGDAVDTAEPLVKAARILDRHWPLLLFLKAGELNTIASVGRRGSVLRANDLTDILGMLRGPGEPFADSDVRFGSLADMFGCTKKRPLCPRKQTFTKAVSMSAKCQQRTLLYGRVLPTTSRALGL
jgi:hypothetical protein